MEHGPHICQYCGWDCNCNSHPCKCCNESEVNTMNQEKEIPTLEQVQSMIAKKYGLGEKLVTGHAKKYFDEASIEFAKLHVNMALEMASIDAQQVVYDGHPHLLKDNIINSYPESNIK